MAGNNPNTDYDEVLRLVVDGAAAETGTDFFRSLVRNLSQALGTSGAWATQYYPKEQMLRSMAMWLNGSFVPHYDYLLTGTACQRVIESRSLVHVPDRLIELFPNDTDLVPMNAVSYLGMPLVDTDGSVMGHISVLDTKEMPRDERAISLFEIFAARAAAELRRLRVEADLRAREEQMSTLLETAMDAIVVLDAELKVVRLNPAAARVFGCTAEDMIGESMHDFLVKDSVTRVEAFARELEARPAGKQQLWVSQDFVARRWDNSVFPAEATLSRFESQRKSFYTLILRNVDERLEAERQIQSLLRETEYLRETVRDLSGQGDLLGRSDCMQAIYSAIEQVAKTDTTVLVTGETGTGKELVARSIHRASGRADKPLVLVNCAAIPANLIESEFFGHERGAFTGAVNRREGRFALANGGTIFLDEIGELPLELQAKLLRVLQEGEFEPLGSTKTVKVNVRVVAATNRDLKKMSVEGKFREDLYFRLNVFPIHIPALRERGRDVELLAAAFAERFAKRMGKRVQGLADEQLKSLRSYDWPGNVRELQNVIERAMILSATSRLELERAMGTVVTSKPAAVENHQQDDRVLSAAELLDLERSNLERALKVCAGKISGDAGAARLVGIPASTFSSRMKALKLAKPNADAARG